MERLLTQESFDELSRERKEAELNEQPRGASVCKLRGVPLERLSFVVCRWMQ